MIEILDPLRNLREHEDKKVGILYFNPLSADEVHVSIGLPPSVCHIEDNSSYTSKDHFTVYVNVKLVVRTMVFPQD